MKSILFVSNLFPNPLEPNMASFNRQQIVALSQYFDIDVVAPVSWLIKFKKRPFPLQSAVVSIPCFHPTYFYTPWVLRNFYGSFFYKSIKPHIKSLFKKKEYQAIYGSWLYPDGWACAKLAKDLSVPLFLKVHGTDVNQLQPGSAVTNKSLEAVAQAKAVFCVSQALKKRLIELGADANKLYVVYNGVDKSIFYPTSQVESRKILSLPIHERLVLYVGNLLQSKGLGELVEAFSKIAENFQFDNVRLLIIGKGSYEPTLKATLRGKGILGRVEFLGSLPLGDIAQWMNAANLLCLPSYREGVPNVVLEALACDTRVVATNIGGVPELAVLDDRVTLVLPRNSNSLQMALEHVLDGNLMVNNKFPLNTWSQNATNVAGIMARSEV